MRQAVLNAAIVAASFAVAVLAGCGGTPGEPEVKEALHRQIVAMVGQEMAERQRKDLDAIHVIGCHKAEAGGYTCDWTGPMGGASGRIVKAEMGWTLVSFGGDR